MPVMHTNVPGRRRGERKSSSRRRGTERLSKRTDFNSALAGAVVVFVVAGLSRGNSPGDTERDSGNGNQHLLPAHGNLHLSPEALEVLGSPRYCNAPFFDLEFPRAVP